MATEPRAVLARFELEQTSVTNLTLGTPYSWHAGRKRPGPTLRGERACAEALLVTLKDSTSTDINQVYAKLGSPPTPGDYTYEFADGVAANQQLLVPSAAPGTWYILVYSVSVPSASHVHAVGYGHADHADHRGPRPERRRAAPQR